MGTLIDKNTKQLMLAKKQKELDDLFAEQESTRGSQPKQYAKGGITPDKAKRMLEDGTVRGKKLTDRQKAYFGLIAGGGTPRLKASGGLKVPYRMPTQQPLYNSISGASGYGLDPWQQQDYNASLSEIGFDPRNTTGFGSGWGQPYYGQAPVPQQANVGYPGGASYPTRADYVAPQPGQPTFRPKDWATNSQPGQSTSRSNGVASMATDPRFGAFTQASEEPYGSNFFNQSKMPAYGSNFFNQYKVPDADPNAPPPPGPNDQNFVATEAPDTKTTNWGKIGSTAAQLAPVVSNLISSLRKDQKLKASDYYNPRANEVMNLMRNRRTNVDPQLQASLNAERTNYYNLHNTANARGELMGNMTAASNNAAGQRSAIYANKQNMDLGYMGQEAEMAMNLGSQEQNANWQTMDYNNQNVANRRNMFRAGLSQLAQYSQNKELMANQLLMDQNRNNIYKDMYSSISPFMEFMKNFKFSNV
jgi:hypothetical protein